MNSEAILGPLSRIPWSLIGFAILLFFGWQYYDFMNNETSALNQEKARVAEIRNEIDRNNQKLKDVESFKQTVVERRRKIDELRAELESKKLAVSESVDAAEFMGVLNAQARRVGLEVMRLEPSQSTAKELYAEHPFKLSFRGVFVQFLVFLERLAKLDKIVRVDRFDVKPSAKAQVSRSLVELEGQMEMKVYRYVNSAADTMPDSVKSVGVNPAGAVTPVSNPADNGGP